MMNSFARLWLVLALTLSAQLAQAVDATALGLAGQQRMLSQRLVKSWCQIGLKVQPELSKAQLDEALRAFDSNMKALDTALAGTQARTALAGLRAAWTPLHGALRGVVRQEDAAQLDARAEDVLMAAEWLAGVLEAQAATPVSRALNLAGRQRMLSQRLVKIYMLQQWQVDSAAQRNEIERVHSEFVGALARLQHGADSALLKAELGNLALQWEWLHAVLATEGAEPFRLIMAEGGEAVLQLADQVTSLYQPAP